MNNSDLTFSPYWPGFNRVWWIVAIVLFLILLILWFLDASPLNRNGGVCGLQQVTSTGDNQATDTEAPTLMLNCPTTISVPAGAPFEDYGAIATDSIDGDVDVQVQGSVDANTPGEYVLTYIATDMAGNTSTLKRTIIVEPKPAEQQASDVNALSSSSSGNEANASGTGNAGSSVNTGNDGSASSANNAGSTTESNQTLPRTAKLYFDSGSAEYPADTELSLAAVIAHLRRNPNAQAVISGFHSPEGSYEYNQELAKQRALSVSCLLYTSPSPRDS